MVVSHRGVIVLPSLGAWTLRGSRPADGDAAQRIRRVQTGSGLLRLDITVDDVDDYRRCHDLEVARRLTTSEFEEWHRAIVDAWALASAFLPDAARGAAAGLVSLVPLQSVSGKVLTATHSDAFGGFAASYMEWPASLASAILHEARHSDINALHELRPLYDDEHRVRYFAPWKPDPRPLGAVIHGLVAFTTVAKFWNAARLDPDLEEKATAEFARLRLYISRALMSIDDSSGLTSAGARIVESLTETVADLMECDLPKTIVHRADAELQSVESRWQAQSGPSW